VAPKNWKCCCGVLKLSKAEGILLSIGGVLKEILFF